jgi:hypothetical protein
VAAALATTKTTSQQVHLQRTADHDPIKFNQLLHLPPVYPQQSRKRITRSPHHYSQSQSLAGLEEKPSYILVKGRKLFSGEISKDVDISFPSFYY